MIFQLTTSQGGRQFTVQADTFPEYFNSRPHKEVDVLGAVMTFPPVISTHDLTRRSTWLSAEMKTLKEFQLTTSQGGRLLLLYHVIVNKYFNSRPHKEVDWYHNSYRTCSGNISTHDLTRRSTAIFTQKVFLSKSLFVLIAYNTFILY